MILETRVMRYFLKIAELGNMSKAAEQLHITQPTLSRQIKALENSLQAPLFSRSNKKMTLTNAGILFQQRAQQILQMIDKTTQDIQDQKELNGIVTIGCVESSVTAYLSQLINEFHAEHPKIRFSLYDGDGDDIREKIDQDLIDIGFVLSPVEIAKYDYLTLPVEDQWALVVTKDAEVAQQDELSPSQLTALPLIVPARSIVQNEVQSWVKIPSDQLNIVGSQNLLSNSLPLVKSGIGDALCAAGSFNLRPDPELKLLPIKTDSRIQHTLIWKRNQNLPMATKAFVDFIREHQSTGNN